MDCFGRRSAASYGGQVVVPPSVTPRNDKIGHSPAFGGGDAARLPFTLSNNALPAANFALSKWSKQ